MKAKRKRKPEKPLTKEQRARVVRRFQETCKHDKGIVTNTNGPSECRLCGKPIF